MTLMNTKKLKLNKTWVVLGIAVGIGLIAALVARSYLSSQMEAIEARAKGSMVNVVVAKHDLRKGEKLSSDSVAVRPIPKEYAHSAAIDPGDFERIDGQALAYPLKSGEMVLWSLVEGRKTPTFSARVEAGRRAMTVPVDEINSISGMLEPGDLIDLIITLEEKDKKVTFPLIQNLQVLATGQRSVDDPKSGERKLYSTVTLDTTPEQAQSIVVAREAGKLTALLRNPLDNQAFTSRRLDVSSLLGSEAQSREVPVLYGGRTPKFAPEDLKLGGLNNGTSQPQPGQPDYNTGYPQPVQILTGKAPAPLAAQSSPAAGASTVSANRQP